MKEEQKFTLPPVAPSSAPELSDRNGLRTSHHKQLTRNRLSVPRQLFVN
ncbi:hypothetical protein RHOER0001_6467 [Rhodococcus erythropolis SK121]|nr:hypothetical protein RHOER0001_6467 [Rhodococcus erythropolis SK121]